MKFVIKHEIKGRIRIHILQSRMTFEQADTLEYYLSNNKLVTSVKVRERLQDATISYIGSREDIIKLLTSFKYNNVEVPDVYLQNSGRELNREYWDKLVNKVFLYGANKIFLPNPIRECITLTKSVKYLWNGVRTLASRKIEVPVLDATAIGVSIARNNMNTAGSIMFLLGIGEILEEWTHKKSVDDLARSMSLNVGKVWLCQGEQDVLVSTSDVREGDLVRVHMGNIIPFDGTVVSGEAMVNQASLTGESIPVQKNAEGIVYAGTVLEEGELVIRVDQTNGSSRYEKIVTMIEESEKLKTSMESKASHLADKLVPYTLLGTGLTYALTRNATKALSVLMVDFSCALKLAMPISVLSAIREASLHNITVKGGKYLEAMAEADTIVFDKTGTLTKANPTVVDVVSFNGQDSDELLRIAACLEEHFPHSMAKAVVDAAAEKNLEHEEVHSEVEYIVAHGISSMIDGQKVVIGSHHFVFEDEKCTVDPEKMDTFNSLPPEYSHLYMAINNRLAAVICIEDPLREEAAAVIQSLKMAGIGKVVMMTGDSDRTAKVIAKKAGIDEYYSEVLPEDKANFVEKEKAKGRKVIMIGDGINDSPALSAADIGVSISDGAEIAREIADVTIGADNLYEIVTLKALSNSLVKRIDKNYRFIVSFNAGLIVLGVAGIIPPTMSALLHNGSTLAIGMKSMENLLD
ncbi:MAG: heavy metal translocating P-type ATPase [Eubacterium ventriosum]|uniref:heavy metal translocating P-type ATPase n=1 Tax=Eubacterium ventriosum TaxID=39496 RepID=UPI001DEC087F|nr:heavy metal translocating P-type ATPase [Eubacterium ventriosum]MBD9055073.1 heavy metal translocating P-type ATPase [Eubacterium ventriosum]